MVEWIEGEPRKAQSPPGLTGLGKFRPRGRRLLEFGRRRRRRGIKWLSGRVVGGRKWLSGRVVRWSSGRRKRRVVGVGGVWRRLGIFLRALREEAFGEGYRFFEAIGSGAFVGVVGVGVGVEVGGVGSMGSMGKMGGRGGSGVGLGRGEDGGELRCGARGCGGCGFGAQRARLVGVIGGCGLGGRS